MKTHTYWIADYIADPDDPSAHYYAIRGNRRKDVVAEIRDNGYGAHEYGKPRKVTVEYESATDLINACLCPGGGAWEIADDD